MIYKIARPYFVLVVAILLGCAPEAEKVPLSPRFNHVFLAVTDLDRSVNFYTSAFDLKVTKQIKKIKRTPTDGETEEYDINLALLKFPGQDFVLEIGQRTDFEADNTNANFTHLGIDVKDINTASERVLNAGAELLRPITLVEAGDIQAKNVFFTGPDGETIELMEIVAGEF